MARIYRKDSVKWELRKKTSEEARKALRGVMESRNLAYLDAARGVGVCVSGQSGQEGSSPELERAIFRIR